jgi:O-antigen ligase
MNARRRDLLPASPTSNAAVSAALPLPRPLGYLVAACVPILGAASFLSPTINDIALAVLVLVAAWVIWHDPRQLRRPLLLLALGWMVFVLGSALWARAEGVPGDPLRNWYKHLFIALGPLIALSFSAAWRRLHWHTDRLLLLFLAGLSGGALLLLIRNGAIGMIAELRPSDGMMGPINRNFAALACGLAIISVTGLLSRVYTAPKLRRSIVWGAALLLTIVLAAMLTLLFLLHSRAGYVGCAASFAVWLIAYVGSRPVQQRRGRRHLLPIFVLTTAIAALSFGGYLALQLSGRTLVTGTAGAAPALLQQVLHGRFDLAYETAQNFEARVQLLTLAADLVDQRPWLGWGPDAWHLVRVYSPLAELRELNQFHNGYAQFLVCFGMVGAALMLAYLAMLTRAAIHRRRRAGDRLSPPLFATAMALLVLLLVFNVSETVLLVKCAASTMMMLAALAALPIENAAPTRTTDRG